MPMIVTVLALVLIAVLSKKGVRGAVLWLSLIHIFVPAEQLRELFAVVHGVELRAADHGDAPGKIAAVELRAGKRRAVRGNDKVRALQIGRCV